MPSIHSGLIPFFILLSTLWFFVYWIFGGVLFALITIIKLGRVRKVRFSCLFTVWALICAPIAAWVGLVLADESVRTCLASAQNKAESITALFGCGFAGVLGSFLLGALVLVLGGFAILSISKTKTKPWIDLRGGTDSTDPIPRDGKYF